MGDFEWKITSLSDFEYDPDEAWRDDLDYRRGCDHTANRILWYVAQLADKKEIVHALRAWTQVLGAMRYDGQLHPMLLDEASSRVTKRLQRRRR